MLLHLLSVRIGYTAIGIEPKAAFLFFSPIDQGSGQHIPKASNPTDAFPLNIRRSFNTKAT